jgi:hypothetical protein
MFDAMPVVPIRICAAFVALLTCASALGDEGDAKVQFEYGLTEMMAGRYIYGCTALEGSFRLDPRPGTLFTLAECQRRWGHTASALASYDEYLAVYSRMSPELSAQQGDRIRIATEAHWALDATVPRMAVRVPDGTPTEAIVERDDVVLSGPMLGAAMPVDPGEHVIRLKLPDGRTSERKESIREGETRSVVVDLPASRPQVPRLASDPDARKADPLSLSATSPRTWTSVALGVGAAGFAMAGIATGVALAQRSTANADCDASGACTSQAGVDAGNDARTFANVATAALVLGAAGLVVAAVLARTGAPASAQAWSRAGVSW